MNNRSHEIAPEIAELEPPPDWSNRPWGRPTVHAASSDISPKLCASVEFRYHGLRIRGVRIFENDNGTLSVNMPQKKFGDSIESVLYFHDPVEREQFIRDVVWLYWTVFGRRKRHTRPTQTPVAPSPYAQAG